MALPPGTDLTKIPMTVNPNGDPPNFEHGPSLASVVQGVGGFLASVTLILLAIRLRVYIKANRGLVWDDVFLILSYSLAIMYTALVSTLGRLCRHTWDTPLSEINEDYMKKLVSTSIVVGPMNFFAKTSLLMLYYRVFNMEVWMRRACWILGIFFVAAYWQTVPQNFVFCMPRSGKPWDASVLQNCQHLKIPGLVLGATNCISDFVVVLLPLPIIIKLHINTSKKIAISGIFASGVLALVCSILGIYYRVMVGYGNDPVWANAQAWIVIQGEVYVTICVACAPSLAKVWKTNFKETHLYNTIMSFLNSARSTKQGSYLTAKGSKSSSDSSPALHQNQGFTVAMAQKQSHYLISERARDGYEMMQEPLPSHGVHREVRIEATSQSGENKMV